MVETNNTDTNGSYYNYTNNTDPLRVTRDYGSWQNIQLSLYWCSTIQQFFRQNVLICGLVDTNRNQT